MITMNILLFKFLTFFLPETIRHFLGHGYPAHFIIGALIAGVVFHWVYKKTSSHLKSWIIAMFIVSAIGLAKELIDPLLGRQRDKIDLVITILGGIIGVAIVILFKNNKTK